uniref:Transmembrane protein 136 n=1 Tax=Tetraselmis sp. GSL018 TaxID=582737 RepID=A0A061RAZ1_9CHLO|mmetsp:Transcript_23668/g.56510  ORF Transcript_23668/g.56510 Transcript_23668/m.56510 type:complete len:234 (-) Transcript_23668:104-805(-)
MMFSSDLPASTQVFLSGLLFSAAFGLSRFSAFPSKTFDFVNRSISILHSVIAIIMCLAIVDFTRPLSRVGGEPSTPQEISVMAVSLGYFLYDTVCCLIGSHDVVGSLHHVATIAGLYVGIFKELCGAELILCLLLMEVSTPFMHLRVMFKETFLKGTRIAAANEVTFGVAYIVCRVFLSSPLMYYTMAARTKGWEHALLKAGAGGLWLISAFWLSKILKVVMGKSRSKAAKSM